MIRCKVFGRDELSRREERLLSRTIEHAHFSSCRMRHAALVYKGGKVLNVATNRYNNDPRIFPNSCLDDAYEHISVHAEVAACRMLGERVRGATIYVARVLKSGEPANSRPCQHCEQYLTERGVKKVIYTDSI